MDGAALVDETLLHGDPRLTLDRVDPSHPSVQILLLSQRVENLCREKEALERADRDKEERLKRIERSFNMGAGILLIVPIIGTLITAMIAYGHKIFRPWTGN